MARKKFTVPNWSQETLMAAVGLKLVKPLVILDNDCSLWIMDMPDRKEYTIDKKTGKVTVS